MSYALYHQVKHQPNLKLTVEKLMTDWNIEKIFFIGIVLLLMLINWTIEAAKWRLLLTGTEKISLGQSLLSVLTGLAISIITPNRVGEYMGRILYLRNNHKLQGITVTIIGSFAQLIVTGFLGMVGLVYYLVFIVQHTWLYVLLSSSILLCLFLGYFYFNLNKIVEWSAKLSFLKKIITYIEIVRQFDQRLLVKILVLSFFRYAIYTIQFLLLFKLLLVEAPTLDLLFTVWVIFWAMAIVPTIAIAEVGIRGETALFFLSPICINSLGIVSSTILLWLINLIIPALIGSLYIFKMKIYEDE